MASDDESEWTRPVFRNPGFLPEVPWTDANMVFLPSTRTPVLDNDDALAAVRHQMLDDMSPDRLTDDDRSALKHARASNRGVFPICDELCFDCERYWSTILAYMMDELPVTSIYLGENNYIRYAPSEACQWCSILSRHLFAHDTSIERWRITPIVERGLDSMGEEAWIIQGFSSGYGDLVFSASVGKNEAGFHGSKVAHKPVLHSFNGSEAYRTIKSWLHQCTHDHASCTSSLMEKPLPTRLVDVGSATQEPFLVHTQGLSGQYMALSYCWGMDQAVKLTTKLVDLPSVVFALNTLPPTLKDAVLICRQLGIRYLWIDALCIVQDSLNNDDWIREAGRMDSTYGNSFLTIAASAAHDTNSGILNVPQLSSLDICALPCVDQSKSPMTLWAQYCPYDVDDLQPLAQRAWAFQEYMLSPRVLSYHKDQLAWECNSSKLYSSGPISTLSQRLARSSRTWQDIVQKYTGRKLTFLSDRLDALAGYAKMMQSKSRDEDRYLAGLWFRGLSQQLLWFSTARPPVPRPSVYRAPTWSWASIDGPIQYPTSEAAGLVHLDIKVLDAVVATSELNPFGTLKSSPASYLRISGLLKRVPGLNAPTVDIQIPDNKAFRRSVGRNWTITFDTLRTGDVSQSANDQVNTRELWCLRVTEYIGLILARSSVLMPGHQEADGIFERVGLVRHWPREQWTWFDDMKRTSIITII